MIHMMVWYALRQHTLWWDWRFGGAFVVCSPSSVCPFALLNACGRSMSGDSIQAGSRDVPFASAASCVASFIKLCSCSSAEGQRLSFCLRRP